MRDEAALFAALGDDTRLGLVARLGEGPSSIAGLTRGGDLTRQAVTKHLYVLERAGLVSCARLGRESLWELRRQRLEEARAFLDVMSQRWDDRLERLRVYVEDHKP
ncbi:arsR family transcriptional regulator [Asticcacaulis biprosthecium C19]|uniref:ArsR family transcriptional regulator n=1 Tax=Asticcacaulis biprosthecium C19 TaxID=715226 RepID=F4QJ95_9CAUL|nr:helix-turn-helix domain-containing protein [Asticcacaulis biprosthecium]EGF91926.1 arsR family transcriptional regulator [Asticcacaulis biprosthecium C19]